MSSAVPDGWSQIKIGDIGSFFGGLTGKTAKDFGEGHPFLTYMQVYLQQTSDVEAMNSVHIDDGEKQNAVAYGDILFTTSSETPDEIGMTDVFLQNNQTPYLNSFCFGLRPITPSPIDPTFGKYVFRGDDFREEMRPLAQGSTRFNLSKGNLAKLSLLVPPLPEQKKIASILTSVDEVIENTQKQIDKLQDLKKATMNELLTKGIGHTEFKDSELGRIPKSWEIYKVSDLLTNSKQKAQKNLPIYSVLMDGGMIPRTSVDRRVESNLSDEDNLFAPKGSLVYNMMRMWQGASGIASVDCLVSPAYVVCLTTGLISSDFLGYLMKSEESVQKLRRYSQGITGDRMRLYFQHFQEIKFSIPPIGEQRKIAKSIDAVSVVLERKHKKLAQTKSLKKSLMQDILTGKVRVTVN